MTRLNLALIIIIAVGLATLLSISITTAALGRISDGTSIRLYSGPRASMALSSNNIYITWWDNKTGNNEVLFAGSNDGGKTFDKEVNLSNAKGGSADSQVSAQGNNVYVTWWDNKTGDWQVFSKASNDNGKRFGDAVSLKSIGNSPVKTLKAPPSNTISVDTIVATSGNNEYVVWWDNSTGNWEISFAKSSDGGKTFGDSINISNSSDSRSVGARMIAQGNSVYLSWMDIDRNTGQKQVLFRESSNNGQTFEKPIIISSNSK